MSFALKNISHPAMFPVDKSTCPAFEACSLPYNLSLAPLPSLSAPPPAKLNCFVSEPSDVFIERTVVLDVVPLNCILPLESSLACSVLLVKNNIASTLLSYLIRPISTSSVSPKSIPATASLAPLTLIKEYVLPFTSSCTLGLAVPIPQLCVPITPTALLSFLISITSPSLVFLLK